MSGGKRVSEEFDEYLKFTLVDPNNADEVKNIDFGEIIALMKNIHNNRYEVISELMTLKIGVECLYVAYRDEVEAAKARVKECESRLVELYSYNDARNPLFGEKKITKQTIDAAYQSNAEYIGLVEEQNMAENYKSYALIAKTAVHDIVSIAKSIIDNPDVVNRSTSENKQDVEDIVKMISGD